MKPEQSIEGQPSIAKAALFGLCPQCGHKSLFAGLGQFADSCANCGLDFSSYNVGDGPAALLTMGIGTLIIVLALGVDSVFHPPFWVHVIIWVPFTAALTVISLRMAKAALLAAEHRNRAREAGKSDLL
ncbi:MAG: DUF983 domain-containing protein [Sphingorhabdus sp.]|jgi:uncharacterized protein (DUF983 family)|uniref:DUF983 domain-containing protein n=1 Tax=Sphingorhabdus sp. TaxID=1902408 RepID=UPI0025F6D6F0|nr:DUF983 domain-containing protein [Sphingorhabdus sp.]MCO4090434.1 DUF983 domain-containing protein [Sphingorhabdus sp.]